MSVNLLDYISYLLIRLNNFDFWIFSVIYGIFHSSNETLLFDCSSRHILCSLLYFLWWIYTIADGTLGYITRKPYLKVRAQNPTVVRGRQAPRLATDLAAPTWHRDHQPGHAWRRSSFPATYSEVPAIAAQQVDCTKLQN